MYILGKRTVFSVNRELKQALSNWDSIMVWWVICGSYRLFLCSWGPSSVLKMELVMLKFFGKCFGYHKEVVPDVDVTKSSLYFKI